MKTKSIDIPSMINQRIAQLSDNNFAAQHCHGGAARQSDDYPELTETWPGADLGQIDQEQIYANLLRMEYLESIDEWREAIDNILCEFVDNQFTEWAADQQSKFYNEHEGAKYIPDRHIEDVGIVLIDAPGWDVFQASKEDEYEEPFDARGPLKTCPECDGKGFLVGDGFSEDTEHCFSCGGSGEIARGAE